MESTISQLAAFVAGTGYDELSEPAKREAKRIILDSIGCGLAGVTSDKGKWSLEYVRNFFSGMSQSSVLGFGDRLSAVGAAFVNAEMINGLDYDASGKHLPPFVLGPALAVAEMNSSSGKELITAVALALEIGTRIGKAMGSYRDVKDGKVVGLPPVTGHSCAVFGGAAGVAKLDGFSEEKIAQSMGLAGLISPANTQTPMHRDLPTNSGKYLFAGWAAQTGITAPYMVKAGHRGDVNILDGEYGYWRYIGASSWDGESVVRDLGRDWRFVKATPIKQFPCCRMMHGGLECLTEIVEKNGLKPDEIESIRAYLEPTSAEPVFHNRKIENQIDAQFSVAYNMAVVAFGIKPGVQWQDWSTIHNEKLINFMDRIEFGPHPGSAEALKADPLARISRVDVRARGQLFFAEKKYIRGTHTPDPDTQFTDRELETKFKENASILLPAAKVDAAYDALYNLDREPDVALTMELLHI